MLTVYHCDSHRTSHHPPRIIWGGFFHPFLLPPSHGQPTTTNDEHLLLVIQPCLQQRRTTSICCSSFVHFCSSTLPSTMAAVLFPRLLATPPTTINKPLQLVGCSFFVRHHPANDEQ